MTDAPRPTPTIAEALDLATQVNRLSHLLGRPYIRDYAAKTGLSLTEWRVFVRIVQHAGTSAAVIAAESGLTAMTVSRAVGVLRDRGLVAAAPDARDARRTQLTCTPEGQAVFDEAAPHAARTVGAIMSALSAEESALFRVLLERIIAEADRH